MRKINRKGDFTEHFLSVLVAVIGIALIVFAVVKLYGLVANEETKNAKKNLEILYSSINNIQNGQSAETILQGYKNSGDWAVVGWNAGDTKGPQKCFFDSCVCVCKLDLVKMSYFSFTNTVDNALSTISPEHWIKYLDSDNPYESFYEDSNVLNFDELETNLAESCQNKGYCKNVDSKIHVFGDSFSSGSFGKDKSTPTRVIMLENALTKVIINKYVDKSDSDRNRLFLCSEYRRTSTGVYCDNSILGVLGN